MNSLPQPTPARIWGIAVAGLSRPGRQHLEQLLLRPDCRIECAWDPSSTISVPAQVPVAGSWQELLKSPAEVIVVAVPCPDRAARTAEALAAGKDVIVIPPISNTATAAAEWVAAAALGRSMIVATQSRWDDDVQAAQRALRDGTIGEPRLISRQLWQSFPRSTPLSLAESLQELAHAPIDQLLFLMGRIPASILAVSVPAASPQATTGLLLVAIFAGSDGAVETVAQIQIHPQAFPPVDTGWMLTGTCGGYAALTTYAATTTEEIVDCPLAASFRPASAQFYDAVFQHLQTGGPNPSPVNQGIDVVRVLDAAARSLRSGNVEPVIDHDLI